DRMQRADNRWVRWLVEMGDAIIQSIDRQQVLYQVVGANAKERGTGNQSIGCDGGARNLDHRADLNVLVEALAFASQFLFRLLQNHVRSLQLQGAADHWIHYADIAVGACPQD